MENGALDYLSFVRGFTAALESSRGGDNGEGFDVEQRPGGADTPDARDRPGLDAQSYSYSEGFAAGSQPVEHTLIYRELSIQDGGRFTGTLDLSGFEPEPAFPGEHDTVFSPAGRSGEPEHPEFGSEGGGWHEPIDQSRTEETPTVVTPFAAQDEPRHEPEPGRRGEPLTDDRVHLSGTLELG